MSQWKVLIQIEMTESVFSVGVYLVLPRYDRWWMGWMSWSRYSKEIETARVSAYSEPLALNEMRDGGTALFPVGTEATRIRRRQKLMRNGSMGLLLHLRCGLMERLQVVSSVSRQHSVQLHMSSYTWSSSWKTWELQSNEIHRSPRRPVCIYSWAYEYRWYDIISRCYQIQGRILHLMQIFSLGGHVLFWRSKQP